MVLPLIGAMHLLLTLYVALGLGATAVDGSCNQPSLNCGASECFATAYKLPDSIRTFGTNGASNIIQCCENCMLVEKRTNACEVRSSKVSCYPHIGVGRSIDVARYVIQGAHYHASLTRVEESIEVHSLQSVWSPWRRLNWCSLQGGS